MKGLRGFVFSPFLIPVLVASDAMGGGLQAWAGESAVRPVEEAPIEPASCLTAMQFVPTGGEGRAGRASGVRPPGAACVLHGIELSLPEQPLFEAGGAGFRRTAAVSMSEGLAEQSNAGRPSLADVRPAVPHMCERQLRQADNQPLPRSDTKYGAHDRRIFRYQHVSAICMPHAPTDEVRITLWPARRHFNVEVPERAHPGPLPDSNAVH